MSFFISCSPYMKNTLYVSFEYSCILLYKINFCLMVLIIVKLTCKINIKKHERGEVVFMEVTFIYRCTPYRDLNK
jgi:hypothetical protein